MRVRLSHVALTLSAILVSAVAFQYLPAVVPIHWNAAGEIDGYGSALWGLLPMPIMMVFLTCVEALRHRLDPKLKAGSEKDNAGSLVMTLAQGLMFAIHLTILGAQLKLFTDITRPITLALGLFTILLGNVLSKVRPNFTVGIRTPWTLSSDEVWRKTHRVGGRIMFVGGLLSVAAGLILPANICLAAVIISSLSMVAAVPYSYLVWRKEQQLHSTR